MESEFSRAPILIGKSGATVATVRGHDGTDWVEKSGVPGDIDVEVAVLRWCASRLPVPRVLETGPGCFAMSLVPGVHLADVAVDCAVTGMAEALATIHAVRAADCPFRADWPIRLEQGERRVRAGLVDETDFDEVNRGRTAAEILDELWSLPAPPEVACFTHGDACLSNFLTDGRRLTGIVDLGRGGIAHPAQDWALALRSMRDAFGPRGERLLRAYLPASCADAALLRQFRLLDELF